MNHNPTQPDDSNPMPLTKSTYPPDIYDPVFFTVTHPLNTFEPIVQQLAKNIVASYREILEEARLMQADCLEIHMYALYNCSMLKNVFQQIRPAFKSDLEQKYLDQVYQSTFQSLADNMTSILKWANSNLSQDLQSFSSSDTDDEPDNGNDSGN